MGKKDKRAAFLAQKVGIAAPKGIAGAASSAAAAGFDMRARIVEAEQAAEAKKEVARQETHQAAIKENANILHELDGALLRLDGDMGTKSKPMPVSLKLSILGAYGIANLFIAAQQDMTAINMGADPQHIATFWQDARTPRTEKWRNTQVGLLPGEQTDTAAAVAAAAAAKTQRKLAAGQAAMQAWLVEHPFDQRGASAAAKEAMDATS